MLAAEPGGPTRVCCGMWHDQDDFLDEHFPLGDGVADRLAEVECPCCGAAGEIVLDPGGAAVQAYVEDCSVCCRPWAVRVRYQPDGSAEVTLSPADE